MNKRIVLLLFVLLVGGAIFYHTVSVEFLESRARQDPIAVVSHFPTKIAEDAKVAPDGNVVSVEPLLVKTVSNSSLRVEGASRTASSAGIDRDHTETPAPGHGSTMSSTSSSGDVGLRDHTDPPGECRRVTTEQVFADWRALGDDVCKAGDVSVTEYIAKMFEYGPTLRVFRNMDLGDIAGDFLSTGCPPETQLKHERHKENPTWAKGEVGATEHRQRAVKVLANRVLVRMRRFDVHNIYEAFHAYLNFYFLFKVLEINPDEAQFVFTDDRERSEMDHTFWSTLNGGNLPVYYKKQGDRNDLKYEPELTDTSIPKRFPLVVDAASTGTSMIVSNKYPLTGRASDHHCKSVVFRNAVQWMRRKFVPEMKDPSLRKVGRPINVIWSSRKPYKRAGGQLHSVSRMLKEETVFVQELQKSLGDSYHVTAVNFGALSPRESMSVASKADVLCGIHGAGLTWASFLPRHGLLVEIFGGDRGSGNRHYHNIASLADIHYRQLSLRSGPNPWIKGSEGLHWASSTTKEISDTIKQIPILVDVQSEPG